MNGFCGKIVRHRRFELASFLLVLLTVLMFVLSTEFRSQKAMHIFKVADYTVGVMFILEYLIRLLASKNKIKEVLRPAMIIDAIVIVSIFHPVRYNLAFFRLLKMFHFLQSRRYKIAKEVIIKVWQAEKEEFLITFTVFFSAVFILASLAYIFEGKREAFSSILRCMYWALITATSVGYGDIVPVTVGGKIIATIIAMTGVVQYGLLTAIFASGFTSEMKKITKKTLDN